MKSSCTSDTPRIFNTRLREQALAILKFELLINATGIKNGKATGPDEIYIETIKLIEKEYLCPLHQVIQRVDETCYIPKRTGSKR